MGGIGAELHAVEGGEGDHRIRETDRVVAGSEGVVMRAFMNQQEDAQRRGDSP